MAVRLTYRAFVVIATVGVVASCGVAAPDGRSAATARRAVASSPLDNANALYVLDGFGGLHPAGSAPPVTVSSYWPNQDLARGVVSLPSLTGGYVLDGWGGVHPYGNAPPVQTSASWFGWDIARGITLTNGGTGGWVVDGWGGVHPFGSAPQVQVSAYWQGWDIARGIAANPTGPGGWVLDGWGGLHPFGGAPSIAPSSYWQGWDIARGLTVFPHAQAGYVLDGWGTIHPLGGAPFLSSAHWLGWDIARGVQLWNLSTPSNPGGWTIDGWGGVHAFGSAPPEQVSSYWPGWDIARGAAGSGDSGGSLHNGGLWGIDSCTSAFSMLGQTTQYMGAPSFVARYLGINRCGTAGVSAAEASYIHSQGARVMLIADTDGTQGANPYADAANAIRWARAIGAPGGVAIFRDVEENDPIASSYITGWTAAFAGSGYVPGLYENPLPYDPRTNVYNQFPSAWCGAIAASPQVAQSVVLWGDQPEYLYGAQQYSPTKVNAPAFFAITPSCGGNTVAWQYKMHGGFPQGSPDPSVDLDEMRPGDISLLW
ncbi:MAG: DUF1906 domain-containing protein [Candidatus Dormibacteraeota bacterium]|nr:DUF1906 domain-containing protein [Candidatus Dormibacteraeota bacterium]